MPNVRTSFTLSPYEIIQLVKDKYHIQMTTEDDICVAIVVMADAPLLYDQDCHRSEAIWHGEVERPTDECHQPWWKPGAIQDRVGPPMELSGKPAAVSDFVRRLPAICVEGRRIWLSRTPLICFEIVELHVPDRVMLQFGLEQVTPPEDVEHVTRISRKGRAGEDWALYHRDYIARREARAEYVIMGSRVHTPRHAPSNYMRWYLGLLDDS
ncbi:hypothetical protein H6P81_020056 [Aristolochia fimbriata]|uniref:Aminotransferase-like plant mobile domain-containing protein n=1 Tax=Aristolochia fimbriata TaxID=158543 RepID=A0AAV7DWE1_ARIFI|nr:hypothetical protein H6P81_020056 [Aristolochia fimbriata]